MKYKKIKSSYKLLRDMKISEMWKIPSSAMATFTLVFINLKFK